MWLNIDGLRDLLEGVNITLEACTPYFQLNIENEEISLQGLEQRGF